MTLLAEKLKEAFGIKSEKQKELDEKASELHRKLKLVDEKYRKVCKKAECKYIPLSGAN